MRLGLRFLIRFPLWLSVFVAAAIAAALPAAAQTSGSANATGPDEPATHLKPYLPPLHLTGAQHQQIKRALAGKQVEVEFELKTTKGLKDFHPTIGEKVSPKLPSHTLPSELTQRLPQLADYKYTKVKGRVLIINPMTGKIVDMFPES